MAEITNNQSEAPKEEDEKCKKNNTDCDGNELGLTGKIIAGVLLLLFTFLSCATIIAFWPDRLPKADEQIAPLYVNELFHVRLAFDTIYCPGCIKSAENKDTSAHRSTTVTDTTRKDTTAIAQIINDTNSKNISRSNDNIKKKIGKYIHLNTLLLWLVALGGFLGNMIHVATSFTTFIGSGKFKRSWILWYCIKPFTASALAIGIYFVFRGGFLNMSDGGASINLYGLMTISIFAGLFTDKATEKLKEVFDVLFKSSVVRADPLLEKLKISSISPLIIEKDKINKITLTGEYLDTQKLAIDINNEAVASPAILPGSIVLSYSIPETQKDKTEFKVTVKDEKGKVLYAATLALKENNSQNPQPAAEEPPVG
jgi:hypothetical protein